jgi:CheY-like chemotaxis protein
MGPEAAEVLLVEDNDEDAELTTRDLLEAYAIGVNSYVVKPVDFAELVEVVEQLGRYWAQLNERP